MVNAACASEGEYGWVQAGAVVSGMFHLVVAALFSRVRGALCLRDAFLMTIRVLLWVIAFMQLLSWVGGGWGQLFIVIAAIATGCLFMLSFAISIQPIAERWSRSACLVLMVGAVAVGLGIWLMLVTAANIYPTTKPENTLETPIPIFFDSIVWEPIGFLTIASLALLVASLPLPTPPPASAPTHSDNHPLSDATREELGCVSLKVVEAGEVVVRGGSTGAMYESLPSASTTWSLEIHQLLWRACLAACMAECSLVLIHFCITPIAHLWYNVLRMYALLCFLIAVRLLSYETSLADHRLFWLQLSLGHSFRFRIVPLLQPTCLSSPTPQTPLV